MTLAQYIARCKSALSANFKSRNVVVFVSDLRQKRIQADRRNHVRRLISELRQATNPVTAPLIAERVHWLVN